MIESVLFVLQQIGFCIYFGGFFIYAIRLATPVPLSSTTKETTLRSFQDNGVLLGLALGLFIYTSLGLYYFENQGFPFPNTDTEVYALACFFLAWIHNTYIEIWGMEALRKSDLQILSDEERCKHKTNIFLVQKNIICQGVLLLLSLLFQTM